MTKFFLPALFASAIALTGCGKKEEQKASEDTKPLTELKAPEKSEAAAPKETAPADTSKEAAPAETEMKDLTAPAEQADKDKDVVG